MIPLVVIESPYAGDVEANLAYCREAMRDCLDHGETPYASHALLTQPGVLDDSVPAERAQGMAAGFALYRVADRCAVYVDRGISPGMRRGIREAERHGVPVEYRSIVVGPRLASAEQVRALIDRVAIEHYGVPGVPAMAYVDAASRYGVEGCRMLIALRSHLAHVALTAAGWTTR